MSFIGNFISWDLWRSSEGKHFHFIAVHATVKTSSIVFAESTNKFEWKTRKFPAVSRSQGSVSCGANSLMTLEEYSGSFYFPNCENWHYFLSCSPKISFSSFALKHVLWRRLWNSHAPDKYLKNREKRGYRKINLVFKFLSQWRWKWHTFLSLPIQPIISFTRGSR